MILYQVKYYFLLKPTKETRLYPIGNRRQQGFLGLGKSTFLKDSTGSGAEDGQKGEGKSQMDQKAMPLRWMGY